MNKKVALIHTSFVFINRETLIFDLFDEILPDVERINIVDDQMLADVMNRGYITPEVNNRMCHYVMAAVAMGVDAIFNTCSSVGPAFDVAKRTVSIPTLKIDDAMAKKAADDGNKVGVMATVPTTLDPTIALIQEKAKAMNKDLETKKALTEGAFKILMDGDVNSHDDMVSAKAKEVAEWADTIVLAQCSMARLAPRLSDETGLPVLSSPRLGVELLKTVLESS